MPLSTTPSLPGKLRIIAGILRNSRIDIPIAADLRPTPERVRETLFNWLRSMIGGSRCLDLFAGTGALGIEAFSRGAAMVDFIESDPAIAEHLKHTITRLKISAAKVHTQDALTFLTGPAEPYDLVFLDPPFAMNAWSEAVQLLESQGWLKSNAYIYVESPCDLQLPLPARWMPYRQGQAGAVCYALYRCNTGIR